MWGAKKGAVPNMKELANEYVKNNTYDQGFLAEQIYPMVIGNTMIHLGEQYDNTGTKTNGYFNDGGKPIPDYSNIYKKIENFPFEEAHSLSGFRCAHCKKIHETFIGAILDRIPKETLYYLKNYFQKNNIETNIIDSLI